MEYIAELILERIQRAIVQANMIYIEESTAGHDAIFVFFIVIVKLHHL